MISPDDAPNPWTRTSRALAYENDWIQVFHDEVLRPDGRPGIYGVVHPRTSAVGVVAIDERDRVLLVGQYRYTLGRYSWEIPEGGVPIGEDPLEGARRELAEETGVRAATWREITRFSLANSTSDETGALYSPPASRRERPTPTRPRSCRCAGWTSPRRSRPFARASSSTP